MHAFGSIRMSCVSTIAVLDLTELPSLLVDEIRVDLERTSKLREVDEEWLHHKP